MSGHGSLVLGVETSCDDTAVALVDPRGSVIASCVASQAALHTTFGGVYPELASRAHIDKILPTVQAVLSDSGVRPGDLAAIGVTRGPGLIGSLMVGLNTAAGLGHGWEVPVIGVNHLRGHLRSADLEESRVKFPAIVLLVSGGHTLLARLESTTDIRLIGSTVDDSVGEAYDKVARMLGLGYPGGPAIDRLAPSGTPQVRFPRPMLRQGLDFSFSGLKSAVERYLAATPDAQPGGRGRGVRRGVHGSPHLEVPRRDQGVPRILARDRRRRRREPAAAGRGHGVVRGPRHRAVPAAGEMVD